MIREGNRLSVLDSGHHDSLEAHEDSDRGDLYTQEDVELLVQESEKKFRGWGFTEVRVQAEPIVDYSGTVFIVPLSGLNIRTNIVEDHALTLELSNGAARYVFSKNNKEVQALQLPHDSLYTYLLEESEHTKIVKSRPAFLYPELFDLPHEEVWPKGKSVAVIGDPYQACDREGVTIVEYEYADEMIPPVLKNAIRGNDEEKCKQIFLTWYARMHDEDMRAIQSMYSGFAPGHGNPYVAVANDMLDLAAHIMASVDFANQPNENQRKQIQGRLHTIQQKMESLIRGTWTIDDFDSIFVNDKDKQGLQEFYEFKENVLTRAGDPKAWEEFVQRWEKYISGLPLDRMIRVMPNIKERIENARHWLHELSQSKSSQRIERGFSSLDRFYADILECAYVEGDYLSNARIVDDNITSARSRGMMSDGAFGFFVPGHPVPMRIRRALEAMMLRADNAARYITEIWPHLCEQRTIPQAEGVTLTPDSEYAYLSSFEHALITERFSPKYTERAVITHGFFPYRTHIDPQDRILALTSVTMHGWNALDESGFCKDIDASLPFIKIGGKYILGPINQHVYFSGHDEGFDARGLTQALQTMADDGRIHFEFHKGRRQHDTEYDDMNEPDISESFSKDPSVLLPGESAHSLVITRLK